MNKVYDLAKQINDSLLNNDTVKKYLSLKKSIKTNKNIIEYEKIMKESQLKYCETKNKKYKEIYLENKKLYENHYLIKQYNIYKEEVKTLFLQVSNIIS